MAPIPFVCYALKDRRRPVGNKQGAMEKHLFIPSRDIPRLETTFTDSYGSFTGDTQEVALHLLQPYRYILVHGPLDFLL